MNWKKMLYHLQGGCIILDENLNIVFVSERLLKKTGVDIKPQEGTALEVMAKTIHPEDLGMVVKNLQKLVKGETEDVPYPILLRAVKADGGYQWNEVRYSVVEDEGKKYFIFVFSDVTQRVELQKRVESLLEYSKFLNSILRHDIMNVLTAIFSYAEMLEEGYDKNLAGKIKEAAEKGIGMIKKLRQLESSTEEDFSVYRLKEVVRNVAKGYNVSVEVFGDAEVIANAGIYNVFENLISNAVKHGKARRIEVRIDVSDMVYVTVMDDGIGIPARIRNKIFEKGFSTAESTGMGLYIVKKLVESFGGDLKLEDSERGSKFVLTFPLSHA